ncbi:carbon monoxide dehydrogenase subunit G [Paraburkholderia youngii]|uniref:SRPBCC family protein n=1 Tax=Paraburkholderia youngii TaxID=2782701 RepID=UPI003D1950FE
MKLSGTYTLRSSPEAVWAALNDSAILQAALPGCKSLERIDERHFTSTIQLRVGPVSATFQITVELADVEPPQSYTIIGQGNAGAVGYAKVNARVRLEARNDATLLHYEADVEVGGKLMSVGARLIQSAAAKNLDAFFTAFRTCVESPAVPVAEIAPASSGTHHDLTLSPIASGDAAPAQRERSAPEIADIGVNSERGQARALVWLVGASAGVVGLVVGFMVGHGGF